MSQAKRSILITGCTKGSAGHALALEFASRGLRVFATGRSMSALEGLAEKGIETLTLDVSKADSIAALKTEISIRTGGKLDMLFNNAGALYEAPAIEADSSRVRQMFDVNVFGVMDMVSAFTPLLLAADSNRSHPPTIINTASVVAVIPYPMSSAYAATKAAIASYSDTLRIELAPLGVKVVTLYMGIISTNIFSADSVNFGPDSLYIDAEAGVKKRNVDNTANGMKPEEFARQVVDEVLKKKPALGQGEYVWKGWKAGLVWLLHTFGWRKIFDSVQEEGIGFDANLKKSIAQKKELAVSKKN